MLAEQVMEFCNAQVSCHVQTLHQRLFQASRTAPLVKFCTHLAHW